MRRRFKQIEPAAAAFGRKGMKNCIASLRTRARTMAAFFLMVATSFCHAAAPMWKPDQHVEIIVATSAGSSSDAMARLLERLLREEKLLAAPAVVVNKPGGGGTIALNYLNQHAGNGSYVMVSSPSVITSYITGVSPVNYTDLTPLARMGADYVGFMVSADSPLKSGRDLIARLGSDTGAVSIALANSAGNHNHIAAALLARAAGGNIKRLKVVIFNGSAEAVTALMGGHVDIVANPVSAMLQLMQAGKIRILGVSSDSRLGGAMSGIPTWKEMGIAAVSANWRTVIGPKGMSEEQIRFWNDAFAKIVKTSAWKNDLESNLLGDTYLDSQQTRKFMDQQYAELRSILGELGLAK
jgi:putative tricarboxylic transport membrane protein